MLILIFSTKFLFHKMGITDEIGIKVDYYWLVKLICWWIKLIMLVIIFSTKFLFQKIEIMNEIGKRVDWGGGVVEEEEEKGEALCRVVIYFPLWLLLLYWRNRANGGRMGETLLQSRSFPLCVRPAKHQQETGNKKLFEDFPLLTSAVSTSSTSD